MVTDQSVKHNEKHHPMFSHTVTNDRHFSLTVVLTVTGKLRGDPGFFLGGGAPLRNGVTDW